MSPDAMTPAEWREPTANRTRSTSARPDAPPAWAVLLLRTRGLLISGTIASIVYAWLTIASRSACASDGRCMTLAMGPSWIVFGAMALTLLLALGSAARRDDEALALAGLNRAGILLTAIPLGSLVVAQIWFWAIPLQQYLEHGGGMLFPFPFAAVTSS